MNTSKIKTLTKIVFLFTVISYLGFRISSLDFFKAYAQNALGISAIPPRLEVTVAPGKTVTKEIKVRNESASEKIMATSVKDFIVTDDKGTPIQIENVDETENRWAASSWVQVSPSTFKLKPGETKSLLLTVVVPDNATAGGHYAMVLHTPSNEASITQNGAAIQTNVGSLVYITIPGKIRQDARITKFTAPQFSEFGPINLNTTIQNLSDIHIAPTGSITVTNWFGGKTATIALDSLNIFPFTSRNYLSVLNRKWLFGRYEAQLQAGYGTTGQALVATIFFWVIPWRLIILLVTLVAIVLALISINKKSHYHSHDSEKVDELEEELKNLKSKYKDRK